MTRLHTQIFVTHLGEFWTRHICLGFTIFCTKNNKECTTGLYTATKTLAFVSKNSVLIARSQVYIYLKKFCYLINHIFQFNFQLRLSGLLNRTIDSDIKVLNHVLLMLTSDQDEQITKPSYKILR